MCVQTQGQCILTPKGGNAENEVRTMDTGQADKQGNSLGEAPSGPPFYTKTAIVNQHPQRMLTSVWVFRHATTIDGLPVATCKGFEMGPITM